MRGWLRAVAGGLALFVVAGCSNPLGRKYEYEEQIYLGADGTASVVVDTSIPALVALRRLPLDPAISARVDREQIRKLFATAGCEDVRVGQSWVRSGRHFVQVRLQTKDVTKLSSCGPLAWSSYVFTREGDQVRYQQTVGARPDGPIPATNWKGTELVAFRLHLPSRVRFHNVKRLEDGSNGEAEHGNILTWEQRLTDRLAGQPVSIDVRMDAQSILYRTLWLFGAAFLAAVVLLIGLIWMTVRRAKRRAPLRAP